MTIGIYLAIGFLLGFRREMKRASQFPTYDAFNIFAPIIYSVIWPVHIIMVFIGVLITLFV